MAREALRNEPSVSCSLKERGLSTSLVAYLYVPLGVVVIGFSVLYLLHYFFFFLLVETMLTMVVYVRQWLLINCHVVYAYLFLFLMLTCSFTCCIFSFSGEF